MEDPDVIRRRITVHSVDGAGYISAYECSSDNYSVTSPQRKELYFMEQKMMKRFSNDSFHRSSNIDSITGLSTELVAVTYSSKNIWARGLILEKKRQRSVQLIDYCFEGVCPVKDFRLLPREFNTSALECQSMKIVLYGIVPASLEIGMNGRHKLTGNMQYHGKDIKFIQEQIENAQSVYFVEKCRVEEFYFGEVFLKQSDGSLLNLKDSLLQSENAIKVPDFEYHIPEYIKNYRCNISAFDHDLAVRRMLFPSITFSDVEQSTGNHNTVYYRNLPVDIEPSDCTKSNMSSSNLSDLHESSNSSISETTPAASLCDTEQPLDEDSHLTDYIDKILVVTGDPTNRFHPLSSFMRSPLDSETFEMLDRLKLRDMTRCQKYLIPAVLTGQNITVIDGPISGKTVGVLISLVSLMRRSLKERKSGLGARAIVVCPYSFKCELVRKTCLKIIQGRERITDVSCDSVSVIADYGLGNELEQKNSVELLKGYDILACTPNRLLRLLGNKSTFNLSRLSIIVFDDMSTLLNSYCNEVKEIFSHMKQEHKHPQRIIISDQWMPELNTLVKKDIELKHGSLLISNYLDAACFVYLRSVWTCTSDEYNKVKRITEMLNGGLELRNVVVVFSNEDDIDMAYDLIRYECPKKQIHMIQDFERLNAIDTVKEWQNNVVEGRYPVLFCTDYALRDINIYEADYLIHYSLPQSKTDFLLRFSVLLNGLQKAADGIMKPGQQSPHLRRRPEMYIFSSMEKNTQFRAIVKIMERLGAKIPDIVMQKVQDIRRNEEMLKKNSGLCQNIKEFGRCHHNLSCKFRHIVLQDDIPDKTLPSCGFIKIHVMYVYSATHFGVRLLGHAEKSTGPWLPVEGLLHPGTILQNLRLHFLVDKNRKYRVHNKIGDIVAYKMNDSFYRVQIMKFLETDAPKEDKKDTAPKRALVKFIDEGREEEIWTTNLMELPTSLASIPPAVVDVFVSNLLPIDKDVAWGDQITRIVREKLMNAQNTDECYFTGKIKLVLGRSLWLDSLTWVKDKTPWFSVPKMLLNQKMAVRNEEHLPLLLRISKEAGFEPSDSPVSSGLSEKNALDKNVDIDNIPAIDDNPSNEDKHSGFENIPSTVNNACSENKVLNRNIDVHDVPSNDDIASIEDNDVGLEKTNPPISIDRSENKMSEKIVDNSHVPSSANGNILCNKNNVFKKSDSSELKGKMNVSNAAPPNALTPKVEWREITSHVILKVHVNSDPNNFTVQVTNENRRKQRLHFSASMDQKFYEFSEILQSKVYIDSVESYKSGVFIVIKMKKLAQGRRWTLLFRGKKPFRWVKMDQNHIDSSDDDSYFPHDLKGLAPRLLGVRGYDDHSPSNSDSEDDPETVGHDY